MASATDLTGRSILTIGYGSGDAAEIIPMQFVEGWQTAAGKIAFAKALETAHDIRHEEYVALHDAADTAPHTLQSGVFRIDRVGQGEASFDDRGIEYYAYGA